LPDTLRHLALQRVPGSLEWEVIVIDNASTDETTTIAWREWSKYGGPTLKFKIINEPSPGKSNALRTGINNALYEYIIICDDDNWLVNDYIETSFRIMQADHRIGAAGGQGIAVSDIQVPEWFLSYQHAYAIGAQSDKIGNISPKKYLWGAGMVFRRSLYKSVYEKVPSFLAGPLANTLSRGEDVEFCMRILFSGYNLYYDDTLIFQHYLPAERLTVAYREKLFKGYDYERRILDTYTKQLYINDLSPFKRVALLCSSLVRYMISKATFCIIWDHIVEAEVIYLLTDVQLSRITDEICKIRQLYKELSPKNNTLSA
jgi:glycosyltransferase involved in cell wall biosynthesis